MGKINLKLPRFGLSLPPPESSKRSEASQPRSDPVRVESPPRDPLALTPARETSDPSTPGARSPPAVEVGGSPRTPTPPTIFLPTTPDFVTPVRSSEAGDRQSEPEDDANAEEVAAVVVPETEVAPLVRKSKKRKRKSSVGERGEETVLSRTDEAGDPENPPARHSFKFKYEGKRPFLHSGKACASFCEKLKVSAPPNVPVLSAKNLYRELSQSSLLTVALSNQLLDVQRREAAEERESSKRELDELRRELAEARERNVVLESRSADMSRRAEVLANSTLKVKAEVDEARKEAAGLKEEVAHLREREAEVEANARRLCLKLRRSRERRVRATKNRLLNEFRGRFDQMKKYITDAERQRDDLLTLNQATTLRDSYESLAKIGVEVPPEWVAKCQDEVDALTKKLESEEVVTIEELDLNFASLVESVADPEDVIEGEVLFASVNAATRAEASGRTTDGDDDPPEASDREETTPQ